MERTICGRDGSWKNSLYSYILVLGSHRMDRTSGGVGGVWTKKNKIYETINHEQMRTQILWWTILTEPSFSRQPQFHHVIYLVKWQPKFTGLNRCSACCVCIRKRWRMLGVWRWGGSFSFLSLLYVSEFSEHFCFYVFLGGKNYIIFMGKNPGSPKLNKSVKTTNLYARYGLNCNSRTLYQTKESTSLNV